MYHSYTKKHKASASAKLDKAEAEANLDSTEGDHYLLSLLLQIVIITSITRTIIINGIRSTSVTVIKTPSRRLRLADGIGIPDPNPPTFSEPVLMT